MRINNIELLEWSIEYQLSWNTINICIAIKIIKLL